MSIQNLMDILEYVNIAEMIGMFILGYIVGLKMKDKGEK